MRTEAEDDIQNSKGINAYHGDLDKREENARKADRSFPEEFWFNQARNPKDPDPNDFD